MKRTFVLLGPRCYLFLPTKKGTTFYLNLVPLKTPPKLNKITVRKRASSSLSTKWASIQWHSDCSVWQDVIASNPNKLSCIKPTNTECCDIWGPQSALCGQRRHTVCNPLLLGTYCWTWETTQRDGSTSGAMEHFLWPKDCVAHSHTSQPCIAVLARPPSVLWGEGRLYNANMMRRVSSLGASDRSFRVFIMWL